MLMSKLSRLLILPIVLLLLVLVGGVYYYHSATPVEKSGKEQFITILWAKWKPADYLQELASKFSAETGIEIRIIQESWSIWQTIFFDEMSRKGERFDMVIGDSQWLGRGARNGHYIELTKWIKNHGVDVSMTPASISGYSEFPKKSGHYWAIPVQGDSMGFSYRKDLFSDLNEQRAFSKRYGYSLAVPKTWYQLKDIAEFFYRPSDDLYGVLCWLDPLYDGITMGVQSLIWSWGANLGNPETYRVRGILDSREGVAALRFYKELNKYNNPDWVHNYLDKNSSSNQPMMHGRVAMAMGYFAIGPELLDPKNNPNSANIGFFAVPHGPVGRAAALGGQGISIISYSRKKDLSLRFIEWFVQDKTQEKWAELGGLSCNTGVLNSEIFLNASPINKPFKESVEIIRDFWTVPEYPQLLDVSQKYFSEYITENKRTAEETMAIIAAKWESIFEYAGYYKE